MNPSLDLTTHLDHCGLIISNKVGSLFVNPQQWYDVAYDDVLWRNLVHQKIQKHAPLPADKHSWREEYKRLAYHIPSYLGQDVAGHEDEIYFLTFSPSGKFLASVGKDGTCRV